MNISALKAVPLKSYIEQQDVIHPFVIVERPYNNSLPEIISVAMCYADEPTTTELVNISKIKDFMKNGFDADYAGAMGLDAAVMLMNKLVKSINGNDDIETVIASAVNLYEAPKNNELDGFQSPTKYQWVCKMLTGTLH